MKHLGRFIREVFGIPQGERRLDSCVSEQERRVGVADSATLRLNQTGYQKGDFIGQHYEVLDLLGQGGFGVVYKIYSHEVKEVLALKTFRDEYLNNDTARELFRREAQLWVAMESHPFLVRAYYVEEISDRLYIVMEYIDAGEIGLNSLEGYLRSQPPDLIQSLRWAIQFCHGMEFAYSKGLRCHRDIKPSNIMIASDRAVRISDFGLAGVTDAQASHGLIRTSDPGTNCHTNLTIPVGGTPTHMAPEQFSDSAVCDQRSDIYSFGVVLYEMASGGRPPFLAPNPERLGWSEIMWKLHAEAHPPRLNSKLFPIIQHCLKKKPQGRYQTFSDLREDLEVLLRRSNGERIAPAVVDGLKAWEWGLKGSSLNALGRFEEALICHNRALTADPDLENAAKIWHNRAISLRALNRLDEVVQSWCNAASSLQRLKKYEEAIPYCDKALTLNPSCYLAWNDRGNCLNELDRFEEALPCFDKAIGIDHRNPVAWFNKGCALQHLDRLDEAIALYERVLELNPAYPDVLCNKALAEEKSGRTADAIHSYEQLISVGNVGAQTQLDHARRRLSELRGA